MSTLLYNIQDRAPAPVDEALVRSTVTVVDSDAPSAVQSHTPDFNETATDPDTQGGLTSRQLASAVTASVRYVPNVGNANNNFSTRIDDQVSSSGTAAAREAAGVWGHGTLQIVEGIEPTLRDGAELGSEYFTTHARPVAGSGNSLTPAQVADPSASAFAQAAAADSSRQAVSASMYNAFHSAFMAGEAS